MDALLIDLRSATRRLSRDRGFAAAAVLMLALGLAACVTAFSVLKGVVLASLPYPGGDRVVVLRAENPQTGASNSPLTPAEAFAMAADAARGDARTFDQSGYFVYGGGSVVDPSGEPRELNTNHVSLGFFPTLGVKPVLGRWFDAEDYRTGRQVAVLSHTEWQRLFGGSADALGKTVTLNGDQPLEVVGVMPPEFRYPSRTTSLWLPAVERNFEPDKPVFRFGRYVNAIGLLRADGAPRDGLAAIGAAVRAQHGLEDDGWRVVPIPLLERMIGEVKQVLWATFGIALLVLLLACSNVAILLGARLAALRHELAVTQALGASAGRLARTLLLELGLLSLAALVAGTALAYAAVEALRQLADGTLARADGIAVDGPVLALAAGLSLAVPLAVVLLGRPSHGAPAEAIRAGGRGAIGTRLALLQRALPSLGIALSTIALVAALALTASLVKLAAVDPGFRTDLYAVQLFRSGGPDEWRRYAAAAKAELAAVPGVEAVGLTTSPPLSRIGYFVVDAQVPGRERAEPLEIVLRRVDADYAALAGLELLRGRGIAASDRAGGVAVAVVNATFAAKVFPGEDAVGKTVLLPLGEGTQLPYEVVGVVADARNVGLRDQAEPEILTAFDQLPWVGMTFLVDSALPRGALAPALRAALWRIDPTEAITREFELREDVDRELAPVRFFAKVVSGFALLALALAAFGVYSLLSFRQRQRTPEFGVRLALGAQPRLILVQVLREAVPATAAGLGCGLLGASAVLALIAPQLYGMEQGAWGAYAAGAAAMLLAVLAATLLPAWRAARTDPMSALHYE
jgi:putative ABC transport system permease protein